MSDVDEGAGGVHETIPAKWARPWFRWAEGLDLSSLTADELRELLAEGIQHVYHLLESADSADRYEAEREREGTHLTPAGTAAIIRGEDLLTIHEALDAAILWALDAGGSSQQVAKYKAIAHALDEL